MKTWEPCVGGCRRQYGHDGDCDPPSLPQRVARLEALVESLVPVASPGPAPSGE